MLLFRKVTGKKDTLIDALDNGEDSIVLPCQLKGIRCSVKAKIHSTKDIDQQRNHGVVSPWEKERGHMPPNYLFPQERIKKFLKPFQSKLSVFNSLAGVSVPEYEIDFDIVIEDAHRRLKERLDSIFMPRHENKELGATGIAVYRGVIVNGAIQNTYDAEVLRYRIRTGQPVTFDNMAKHGDWGWVLITAGIIKDFSIAGATVASHVEAYKCSVHMWDCRLDNGFLKALDPKRLLTQTVHTPAGMRTATKPIKTGDVQ